MKIAFIITSNDPETVWNALRLANFALKQKDTAHVFLSGKGVEIESLDTERFKITEQLKSLVEEGGTIEACTTCLKIRQSSGSELCPLSTLQDLYDLIKNCDKVLTY